MYVTTVSLNKIVYTKFNSLSKKQGAVILKIKISGNLINRFRKVIY
jgi:hypothetical protein